MAVLSDEIRSNITALLPRYPAKQAVTLPALHMVHEAHGYVGTEHIVEIADLLDLHPTQVQDTMTFYMFFKDTPEGKQGKNRLWVCRGLACMLRGAYGLLDHCEHRLGVPPGGTTPDGKITLEFAECIGACDGAPAYLLNDVHVINMDEAKTDELVHRLAAQGA